MRLTCLDGLRGVLAFYVMLSHTAPLAFAPMGWTWLPAVFSHGGAAVDAFFILSGLVILRSLEAFRHQARPFLIARAARIFPVFLPVFALALLLRPLDPGFGVLPWIAAGDPVRDMVTQGWPAALPVDVLAHLTMTHGLFPDGVLPYIWVSLLGPAWSLSTEWQFYILALLLAVRVGSPTRLAWVFLALAAAALAWAWIAPAGWTFSRAFLPNKAQYFALGIASTTLVARGRAALPGYAAVLVATMALCFVQGGAAKLVVPLAWSLCLGAQLGWVPMLGRILRAGPLLWLGAISYPLYLVHEPLDRALLAACAMLAGGSAALFNALWLPLALAIPTVAAWALHHVVETPGLRQGRALVARSPPVRLPA